MISHTQLISPWVYALLGWSGGVGSTVVGSWVSSKIRVYHDNRKAHLDDLKQRVLAPLREGLEQHFRPLVFLQQPLVYVDTAAPTEFREDAKATESQMEQGDVHQGAFPSSLVFGPLDPALLEDAKKTHYSKQLAAVDEFINGFLTSAGECHTWVCRVADAILKESSLPAFPNRVAAAVGGPAPYVMHYRVAVFIYARLLRYLTPALRTSQINNGLGLHGEDATLAYGSGEQISNLLARIDHLLGSERDRAGSLRGRMAALQESFPGLISQLDYAIAARRLRKKCDLVPFF